jgi:membrane-bound inhibitor of C-type lysozyme
VSKDKILLREPEYYVLYRNQRKNTIRLEAQFRKYGEAKRYVRSYRALRPYEFVTIETRCKEDDEKVHLLYEASHESMQVVVTDDGLRVMPNEVAAVYDQERSREEGE